MKFCSRENKVGKVSAEGQGCTKPRPQHVLSLFWGEAAQWLSVNCVKPQSFLEVNFGVTALWNTNDVDMGKVQNLFLLPLEQGGSPGVSAPTPTPAGTLSDPRAPGMLSLQCWLSLHGNGAG